MGKLKLIAVLIIAMFTLMLGLAYTISACYNPLDQYSYEVVLNKPGVKFNIENLIKAGYKRSDNVYIKQSVDPRVNVIVSLVSLDELRLGFGKALSLRFQLKNEYLPARGYLGIFYVKNASTAITVHTVTEDGVTYVFSKTNGGVNIVAIAFNYRGSLLEFEGKVLDYIVHKLKVSEENIEMSSLSEISVPIVDLKSIEWNTIVKGELKELIGNNVIEGLDMSDVEEISKIAKPGLAGWNSRVVYYNGSWIPYYETGSPMLLKCTPSTSSFTLIPTSYERMPPETTVTVTPTATPKPLTTVISPATTKPTPVPAPFGMLSSKTEHVEYEVSKETSSPLMKVVTIFIVGALLSVVAWFVVRRIV